VTSHTFHIFNTGTKKKTTKWEKKSKFLCCIMACQEARITITTSKWKSEAQQLASYIWIYLEANKDKLVVNLLKANKKEKH
jgi:hypothetical protein